MEAAPAGLAPLEKFKISNTIREILDVATSYATSGVLGVGEFFRAAVHYGQGEKTASAGFLYETLREAPGSNAFDQTFFQPPREHFSQPELAEIPSAESPRENVEVEGELIRAFDYSVFVRSRTGGKDRFLGLRHVLFSLFTLPNTVSRLNLLLQPMKCDAAWLASRLMPFLQDSLEPGERWEEWLKLFGEAGLESQPKDPTPPDQL